MILRPLLFMRMKKLASLHPLALSVVIFLAMTFAAPSATITVATNMNWSSLTGGSQSGGQPNSADTVIVNNNATLTIDATNDLCGFLQLGDSTNASAGGSIVFNPGSSLLVDNGVFPPSGILTIGVSGGGPGSINLSAGGRSWAARSSSPATWKCWVTVN